MTSLDVTKSWRFRQTSFLVIISLKIIYTVNRRHCLTHIDVHRERTVTPRTARALDSKSLPEIQGRHLRRRLTDGCCVNEGFPWLSRWSGHCRKVSRTPVNIRADSGLTRGPGESLPESGSHQKDAVFWTAHAVPGMSLPESGRHQKDAVFWTAHAVPGMSLPESGRHQKDTVFWTAHAVPGMSLPEIIRHRKDAAFWTAHALPGNLHLKSERASPSTWLSGQTTVSNA